MSDLATYPQQDNYSTRLAEKYSAGGSTMIVNVAPSFTFGVDFYIVVEPGSSNARAYKVSGISSQTFTIDGSAPVPTYEGESPTSIDHGSGAIVIISDNFANWDDIKDAINTKVNREGDTMTGLLQFSGTDHAGLQLLSLTTTERDALTPANGMLIYNETTSVLNQYIGGSWQAVDSGATPNADTTTAGKLEIATSAESIAGTDIGGSGASNSVLPSDVAANDQSRTFTYAADSGAADAYVVTLVPALTAYTEGTQIQFKATNANTGASTVNVNGLGAQSIKKDSTEDLIPGDIIASQVVTAIYDGTNFQMSSPPAVTDENTISMGVNETVTAGQVAGFQDLATFANSTNDEPVGNISGREKVSFPVIGNGISQSDIKLALKKVGSPGDNFTWRIETDNSNEPSGTLAEANATGTLAGASITTGYVDTTLTAGGAFILTKYTLYWLVLERSGAIDAVNYYSFGEDNTSIVTVNNRIQVFDGATWSGGTIAAAYHSSSTANAFRPACILADASNAGIANPFGFFKENITDGDTGLIQVGGVNKNQTGLVENTTYFLSDTAGAISASAGSVSIKLGLALETTDILIVQPPL